MSKISNNPIGTGRRNQMNELLRLNLQFFSDEDSSWDEYLSEQVESVSVDDQPEVESEETTEEIEDVIEHEVEPDGDERTEEDEIEESEEVEEVDTQLDDDTEIELGEDKQPVKLSELKQGYLRQSDYTKKTQALAEERKEFESLQAEYEPIKQWTEYWSNNPYLKDQILGAIQEWENTGVLPIEQVLQNSSSGKYINHLLKQLRDAEQKLEATETNYQSTKFESEFTSLTHQLQADYGELADETYLADLKQQATEQGLSIDVLKRIADGDLAKKQLEQEKQNSKTAVAKAKQKQKSKRLPPQPSQKGQKPVKADPNDIETDDWLEFFQAASQ